MVASVLKTSVLVMSLSITSVVVASVAVTTRGDDISDDVSGGPSVTIMSAVTLVAMRSMVAMGSL